MDRLEPGSPARAEPPPASQGVGADRLARALLALALVLGLLRFVRLGHWSLWIDESLTWADAHHGIEGGEIRNPLGYRLIAATVDLLGGVPTEGSLRLLPAVAGWLCVPLTFLAFRGTFGARRASLASLLVALSSWHLYWSQNARFYTLAQLAALVGAWILLTALARGRGLAALLGLVVAALAALFHPSAALALPALALGPFLLELVQRPVAPAARRASRVLALAALVGALVAAGWALQTWRTYAYQKGQDESLASIAHFVKTTGFFVTPLLCTALVVGAWAAWAGRRGADLLALAVVASSLLLALCAAAFVRVSAQYVFVVLPWIALVAAFPLGREAAGPLGRRGEAAWALVLALPALVTCGLYLTVRRGERPAWREAYQHVANARGPEDQVFGMEASVGEYYLAPGRTDLRRPTALSWLDYFHARLPEHWAAKGRRQWFVVNPEQFAGWEPRDAADFQRFLREQCRLDAVWPLYVESRDLSVWVYRRD
ncbi:MAG: glycosyltransferase family 39 protein [Planctomycetes bacterium]|nr:glycosyltransferase family 39 protein [Planctomycetota bacterium]